MDANDIICLYRDENGLTQAKHIFEEAYFRDKLEYIWPGEVFLSMSQKELVEKMLEKCPISYGQFYSDFTALLQNSFVS